MHYQEYMVKKPSEDTGVFFFAHSFKTAKYHAERYMANLNSVSSKLYRVNEKPYGNRWLEVL